MTRYGYARLSKEDSGNLTIDAQIANLLKHGILREHIFVDDGKSGGVKEENIERQWKEHRYYTIIIDLGSRKAFCQLRDLLKPGDEVLMGRWDRLSRHLVFLTDFCDFCETNNIAISAIDESNERLTRIILTVLAEQELRKTALRNKSIAAAVYDMGGWPYKSPAFLIKNTKDDHGKLRFPNEPEHALLIDHTNASTVRDIFERMARGEPAKTIAERLSLNVAVIYAVVRNRVYCGETHYDDSWKQSPLIPALINEQTWTLANKNIKTKPPIPP